MRADVANLVGPHYAASKAGLEALEGASLIHQMLLHWNPEWDDDLLVRESLLYLIASGHSTSTAITHAVNELSGWFDKHPEQWDLRLDPEFLTKAAQETLRLHVAQNDIQIGVLGFSQHDTDVFNVLFNDQSNAPVYARSSPTGSI